MPAYSNHPQYAFDLVKLINDYRESKGVQPLIIDHTLMDLSQDYTELLNSTGRFTHTADGQYPWTRIAQSGFEYAEGLRGSNIGNENLHYGYSSVDGYDTPQESLEGWINSSGHNRNMLDPDWDRVGIGYKDGLYTANFGDAPDQPANDPAPTAPTSEEPQPEAATGGFSATRTATFDAAAGRVADYVRVKLSDLVDEDGSAGRVRIEMLNEDRLVASATVNVPEPGGTFRINPTKPFDQIRVKSAESDVTGVVAEVDWTLVPAKLSPQTPDEPAEGGFGPKQAVAFKTPEGRLADDARITFENVVDRDGSVAQIRIVAFDDGRVVASQTVSVREPGGTVTFDPSEGFDEVRIRSGEADVTGVVGDVDFDFLETAPQPGTSPEPSPIGAFELRVIELTNAARTERGLAPLSANAELNEAADRHAEDMAAQKYFSHLGRDGDRAWDRGAEVGYSSRGYGENIAFGQDTPEQVVEAWMNSSGHRANILNSNYTDIGVGYEEAYWVQNFGTGDTNPDSFLL